MTWVHGGLTCRVCVQDNSVWGWGNAQNGRLCTAAKRGHCVVPAPLSGFEHHAVVSVAAGDSHSLALTSMGVLFAWGRDSHGQLGLGGKAGVTHTSPRRVEGQLRRAFVAAVAAGAYHTCVVTEPGEGYCWGDNSDGQLGLGASAAAVVSSPAAVPMFARTAPRAGAETPTPAKFQAQAVSAAGSGTLVMAGGRVYEWGDGRNMPVRVRFHLGRARGGSYGGGIGMGAGAGAGAGSSRPQLRASASEGHAPRHSPGLVHARSDGSRGRRRRRGSSLGQESESGWTTREARVEITSATCGRYAVMHMRCALLRI